MPEPVDPVQLARALFIHTCPLANFDAAASWDSGKAARESWLTMARNVIDEMGWNADRCGGCRGLGGHSPRCVTQPGWRWRKAADGAESIGDLVGDEAGTETAHCCSESHTRVGGLGPILADPTLALALIGAHDTESANRAYALMSTLRAKAAEEVLNV
jgi:hypothetical protein